MVYGIRGIRDMVWWFCIGVRDGRVPGRWQVVRVGWVGGRNEVGGGGGGGEG